MIRTIVLELVVAIDETALRLLTPIAYASKK